MALNSQRASASSAPTCKYDMFLSFSGKDTRRGIVSSLYHELQAKKFKPFMDSIELEAGTEISSHLLTAIQESKSAIVFLSPNYAFSTWCLEELANILEYFQPWNKLVIPVFYNVQPSDVRHQMRSFAEAFTGHEQRFYQADGIERVKRWRAALTKVANLTGLCSKKYESDRDLVHHILELVESKFTRQAIDRIPEPASRWKHDVFLNFTGEDTGEGLITQMYHQLQNTRGLTIFKDDGKLKNWTAISTKLLTAIEESKFAIIVLTPDYASSTWCLEVLSKTFQYMKDKNRILPLFYNVDPSDVRNQKRNFELAFAEHDAPKVKQWRLALKKVSNLPAWDSKNYESETKLVEHVSDVVCNEVQKVEKSETSTGYYGPLEPPKGAVDNIMEWLQHDEVAIVGVSGMGGVGKTTMVKYIGALAQTAGLVNHVIRAVVSKTPDLKKIQGTLAYKLGLKLQEETLIGRACRLHERIISGDRILIILDDTWKREDLSSIGIPDCKELISCKSKLLITSTRQNVCRSMGCQTTIHLNVLPEKMSWDLFVKEARKSVDPSSEFAGVVHKVVRACAGLPLALIAVARALRDKDLAEWNEAARQLMTNHSSDLDYEAILFKCLKLSYDFLGSEDAKSCFLLCSLFPEGYNIRIEDLLRYCIGKGFFQDSTIQNARAKVRLAVKYLKDSSLLWDIKRDECVRMHDFMNYWQNMGKVTASCEESLGFLVNGGSSNATEGDSAIFLMRSEGRWLPRDSEFPNLLILLLRNIDISKMPETFFQSLNVLRVLDLSFSNIAFLPLSFIHLTNLETLILDYCDQIIDISMLGYLKKLKILSMREFLLDELPKEIGNLTNLRMLDLGGSYNISAFPFKLLSKLYKLEELYMQCIFGDEKSRVVFKEEEEANAVSDEETGWRPLNILELRLSDAKCLPEYVEFIPHWVNFDICISKYRSARASTLEHDFLHHHSRVLTLDTTINSLPNWFIKVVVEETEKLEYIDCKGLNDILVEYDHGRLVELKYLAVTGNHENLEVLMNTITWVPKEPVFESLEELHLCEVDSLKELCVGKLPPGSLCNLKILVVSSCMKLKSLFTWDMLRCLSQLEDLSITQCASLERVIESREETLNRKIVFPELKKLVLLNLPQLTWFYGTGSATIKCLALEHLHVQNCPNFLTSTSDFHSWNQVRVNDLRHLRSSNDEMWDVTSVPKEEYEASLIHEEIRQSPSLNERQLVEALQEFQSQRNELEAKYLEERAALEAKFQKVVSTYVQQTRNASL